MRNYAQSYATAGFRKVHGWLEEDSADFIFALGEVQDEQGTKGSVCEIGVHHGKLFILMLGVTDASERALAIDLFENQSLNVDRSGRGDFDIFMNNVRTFDGSDERVKTISRSSLEVSPEEIIEKVGKVRLFSVDGGHTCECAENDLVLAQRTIADTGVVILDDFYNAKWPGVLSGTVKYLERAEAELRPFAITPNKLYLAKENAAGAYRKAMRNKRSKRFFLESELFGSPVDIYYEKIPTTFRRRLANYARDSSPSAYKLVRDYYRRFAGKKTMA